MRVIVLMLTIWLLGAPVDALAQQLPRWTRERANLVKDLVVACGKDGGFELAKLPGSKTTYFRVADRKKVRATIAARRGTLGPNVRDALLAWWGIVRPEDEPAVEVLLDALGRETNDEYALGTGAFLAGEIAKRHLRLKEAAVSMRRAVAHFDKAKQTAWQANSLNSLSVILRDQGHFTEALDSLSRSLALVRKLYPSSRYPDGHVTLATILNNLSVLLGALGRNEEALESCKQALTMRRKLYPLARYPDGHPDLANSLNTLASVLKAQGSYGEALAYFRLALELRSRLYPPARFPNGHPALAQALNNLGSALNDQDANREALVYYRQALAMYRELYPASRYPDGHPDVALGLHNVGSVLHQLGLSNEALGYLRDSLEMARKLYPPTRYPDGHPELPATLNNLATVFEDRGLFKEAVDYFKEALAMRRKLYPASRYPRGHPQVALSLSNLGSLFLRQDNLGEALKWYSEALQLSRITEKPVDLDGGPPVAGSFRCTATTAIILQNRALVLADPFGLQGPAPQLRRAERSLALAAAMQDRVRETILRDESDKLRHGEKNDLQFLIHLGILAQLFHQEGRVQDLEKAFNVIEQGRARVFLESLGQAHAATLAGLPPKLAAEDRRLSLALRELDARIQRLSLQPGEEPARQVRQLSADRLKLEEQEKAFLAKLRQSHPQYAGFRHPQPCSVAHARSCLGKNEVALLFAVGRNFSYALLLEKAHRPGDKGEGIALVRLPGSKELSPLLGTLLTPETLERPHRARELAAELYRKLLGPLQDRLKGKDLLLVPDGALALVPFEMLVEAQTEDEDGHWLLEKHRIRYAPSLSALHLSRQVKRDKSARLLWALADPIFDARDARLKGEPVKPLQDPALLAAAQGLAQLRGGAFSRLRHSGREVEAICKALGVSPDKAVSGIKASEAAVKAAKDELAKARFVHFATHGLVSERSAYATALVLNQVGNDGKEQLGGVNDGFLRLPEVTFLKFNADVVVLSACETAKGRRSGGEGISGLARTFLYRGSKAVVCSLWSVDDARTADLMAAFYGNLKGGQEAAEALRQAQLALMRKGLAPFFWAPFILMGQ